MKYRALSRPGCVTKPSTSLCLSVNMQHYEARLQQRSQLNVPGSQHVIETTRAIQIEFVDEGLPLEPRVCCRLVRQSLKADFEHIVWTIRAAGLSAAEVDCVQRRASLRSHAGRHASMSSQSAPPSSASFSALSSSRIFFFTSKSFNFFATPKLPCVSDPQFAHCFFLSFIYLVMAHFSQK